MKQPLHYLCLLLSLCTFAQFSFAQTQRPPNQSTDGQQQEIIGQLLNHFDDDIPNSEQSTQIEGLFKQLIGSTINQNIEQEFTARILQQALHADPNNPEELPLQLMETAFQEFRGDQTDKNLGQKLLRSIFQEFRNSEGSLAKRLKQRLIQGVVTEISGSEDLTSKNILTGLFQQFNQKSTSNTLGLQLLTGTLEGFVTDNSNQKLPQKVAYHLLQEFNSSGHSKALKLKENALFGMFLDFSQDTTKKPFEQKLIQGIFQRFVKEEKNNNFALQLLSSAFETYLTDPSERPVPQKLINGLWQEFKNSDNSKAQELKQSAVGGMFIDLADNDAPEQSLEQKLVSSIFKHFIKADDLENRIELQLLTGTFERFITDESDRKATGKLLNGLWQEFRSNDSPAMQSLKKNAVAGVFVDLAQDKASNQPLEQKLVSGIFKHFIKADDLENSLELQLLVGSFERFITDDSDRKTTGKLLNGLWQEFRNNDSPAMQNLKSTAVTGMFVDLAQDKTSNQPLEQKLVSGIFKHFVKEDDLENNLALQLMTGAFERFIDDESDKKVPAKLLNNVWQEFRSNDSPAMQDLKKGAVSGMFIDLAQNDEPNQPLEQKLVQGIFKHFIKSEDLERNIELQLLTGAFERFIDDNSDKKVPAKLLNGLWQEFRSNDSQAMQDLKKNAVAGMFIDVAQSDNLTEKGGLEQQLFQGIFKHFVKEKDLENSLILQLLTGTVERFITDESDKKVPGKLLNGLWQEFRSNDSPAMQNLKQGAVASMFVDFAQNTGNQSQAQSTELNLVRSIFSQFSNKDGSQSLALQLLVGTFERFITDNSEKRAPAKLLDGLWQEFRSNSSQEMQDLKKNAVTGMFVDFAQDDSDQRLEQKLIQGIFGRFVKNEKNANSLVIQLLQGTLDRYIADTSSNKKVAKKLVNGLWQEFRSNNSEEMQNLKKDAVAGLFVDFAQDDSDQRLEQKLIQSIFQRFIKKDDAENDLVYQLLAGTFERFIADTSSKKVTGKLIGGLWQEFTNNESEAVQNLKKSAIVGMFSDFTQGAFALNQSPETVSRSSLEQQLIQGVFNRFIKDTTKNDLVFQLLTGTFERYISDRSPKKATQKLLNGLWHEFRNNPSSAVEKFRKNAVVGLFSDFATDSTARTTEQKLISGVFDRFVRDTTKNTLALQLLTGTVDYFVQDTTSRKIPQKLLSGLFYQFQNSNSSAAESLQKNTITGLFTDFAQADESKSLEQKLIGGVFNRFIKKEDMENNLGLQLLTGVVDYFIQDTTSRKLPQKLISGLFYQFQNTESPVAESLRKNVVTGMFTDFATDNSSRTLEQKLVTGIFQRFIKDDEKVQNNLGLQLLTGTFEYFLTDTTKTTVPKKLVNGLFSQFRTTNFDNPNFKENFITGLIKQFLNDDDAPQNIEQKLIKGALGQFVKDSTSNQLPLELVSNVFEHMISDKSNNRLPQKLISGLFTELQNPESAISKKLQGSMVGGVFHNFITDTTSRSIEQKVISGVFNKFADESNPVADPNLQLVGGIYQEFASDTTSQSVPRKLLKGTFKKFMEQDIGNDFQQKLMGGMYEHFLNDNSDRSLSTKLATGVFKEFVEDTSDSSFKQVLISGMFQQFIEDTTNKPFTQKLMDGVFTSLATTDIKTESSSLATNLTTGILKSMAEDTTSKTIEGKIIKGSFQQLIEQDIGSDFQQKLMQGVYEQFILDKSDKPLSKKLATGLYKQFLEDKGDKSLDQELMSGIFEQFIEGDTTKSLEQKLMSGVFEKIIDNKLSDDIKGQMLKGVFQNVVNDTSTRGIHRRLVNGVFAEFNKRDDSGGTKGKKLVGGLLEKFMDGNEGSQKFEQRFAKGIYNQFVLDTTNRGVEQKLAAGLYNQFIGDTTSQTISQKLITGLFTEFQKLGDDTTKGFWNKYVKGMFNNFKVGEPFTATGGVNINTRVYSSSGIEARQSPLYWILSSNADINIYKLNIPFSALVSVDRTEINLKPPPPDPGEPEPEPIKEKITNTFARIGASPNYKWIKAHGGHRNMTFSDYTLNNITYLGGGLELNPGNVRFATMIGRLASPEPQDEALFEPNLPQYTRAGWSTKVGYGNANNFLDFILLKAKDREESIAEFTPQEVQPNENLVMGLNGQKTLFKNMNLSVEYARSATSTDTGAGETGDSQFPFPNFISPERNSTLYGSMLDTDLSYNAKNASFAVKYQYIEPNYQSLGAYFFNQDMENFLVNTTWAAFGRKLQFTGDFGIQRDNVDNAKPSTLTRIIGSANTNFNAGNFNLAMNYSNYTTDVAFVLDSDLDSLNAVVITQDLTLNSSYNILTRAEDQHNFTLTGSIQDVTDDVTDPERSAASKMLNASLVYSYLMKNGKTSINTNVNYNENELSLVKASRIGAGIGVSQNLLENKMNIGVKLNYFNANVETENDLTNSTFNLQFNSNYRISPAHYLVINCTLLNWTRKDNTGLDETSNEFIGNISYQLNFATKKQPKR